MTWAPGDRLVVRGTTWMVARSNAFSDCEVIDLTHVSLPATLTLLVPFDRPRPATRPRLQVVSRRRWAREVSGALRAAHPYGGLRFCPDGIQLMAYQLEPALAMLRHAHARVLVADDVGLGKTVQAGLIVREIERGVHAARVLVLSPASVRNQWKLELATLFDLAAVDADAAWLRRSSKDLPADVNPWSLPGVYLASMDFVKRPEALHPLESVRWDLMVLDEAHAATSGSDRRAAVHALALRSHRLLLLTATPHSGDDTQFADLCAIGAQPSSPSIVVFSRTRHDTPLSGIVARSRFHAVRLSAAEHQMHRLLEDYTSRIWAESSARPDRRGELIAAVLRKRALSSAASVTLSLRRRLELITGRPRIPDQLTLPLEDDGIAEDAAPDGVLAGAGLADQRDEERRLGALVDAAVAAGRSEAKVRSLLGLLRRVREPALVFTEYRDTAEQLRHQLAVAGHDVAIVHGGLSERERTGVLARFGRGGSLLVATDAASEGLNLHHHCRLVIHFELPWTPTRLHQRRGRVSRIGQTRRVHEIALVASDTCEQLVIRPLLERAAHAAGFARTPLVERLPESRVAAHVLGDASVDGPPRLRSHTPPRVERLDLREEAAEETSRLAMLRRVAGRSPRPARRSPAIIPITHSRRLNPCSAHPLTLVVRISLMDARGSRCDDHVMLLSVDDGGVDGWALRRADLRSQVERVLDAIRQRVDAVVEGLVQRRASGIAPVRNAALARARHRRELLRHELRSTARDLVQAGLFDRRALRLAAARRQVDSVLLDDLDAREVHDPDDGNEFRSASVVLGIMVGGR